MDSATWMGSTVDPLAHCTQARNQNMLPDAVSLFGMFENRVLIQWPPPGHGRMQSSLLDGLRSPRCVSRPSVLAAVPRKSGRSFCEARRFFLPPGFICNRSQCSSFPPSLSSPPSISTPASLPAFRLTRLLSIPPAFFLPALPPDRGFLTRCRAHFST